MKADVVLRLCPDRATFGVFFTYSNTSLRTLLATAGVCYEAAVRRSYCLPRLRRLRNCGGFAKQSTFP